MAEKSYFFLLDRWPNFKYRAAKWIAPQFNLLHIPFHIFAPYAEPNAGDGIDSIREYGNTQLIKGDVLASEPLPVSEGDTSLVIDRRNKFKGVIEAILFSNV